MKIVPTIVKHSVYILYINFVKNTFLSDVSVKRYDGVKFRSYRKRIRVAYLCLLSVIQT